MTNITMNRIGRNRFAKIGNCNDILTESLGLDDTLLVKELDRLPMKISWQPVVHQQVQSLLTV